MALKLVNVGYGNLVAAKRVVAVIAPDSAPVRRLVQQAQQDGRAVDATCGHKTRAVLVTDTDHLVLSALLPETLGARLQGAEPSAADEA